MAVNPRTLTLETALEARQSPPGEKCAICQELLEDAPPEYSPADERKSNTDRKAEMEAVITKVCGNKHFFHRVCIESWWKSSSPHLNTCPIDRTLCYGNICVAQTAVNLPEYARFLGHNPHAHRAVYPSGFIEQLLADYAEQLDIQSPDYLLREGFDVDLEELDLDRVDADLNALPGRAIEDVQAPLATDLDSDPIDVFMGLMEIVADRLNPPRRRHDRPGRNDALADSIARGLLPAPRVPPFTAAAEPEAYQGLDIDHLVGFFDNEEDSASGGDLRVAYLYAPDHTDTAE